MNFNFYLITSYNWYRIGYRKIYLDNMLKLNFITIFFIKKFKKQRIFIQIDWSETYLNEGINIKLDKLTWIHIKVIKTQFEKKVILTIFFFKKYHTNRVKYNQILEMIFHYNRFGIHFILLKVIYFFYFFDSFLKLR